MASAMERDEILTRNRPNILVFDLDGTLVETHQDIAVSLTWTLAHFDRPPMPAADVPPLLGWGIEHVLESVLATKDAAMIATARELYFAHHTKHCADHARIYDGVIEMLKGLRNHGCAVGLLSNKPHALCERLLTLLDMRNLFHTVFGADVIPWKKPDPRCLLHVIGATATAAGFPGALDAENADVRSRALYVGDAAVDIATSRAAGVRVAFVRTGYGRIEDQPPDFDWPSAASLLPALGFTVS